MDLMGKLWVFTSLHNFTCVLCSRDLLVVIISVFNPQLLVKNLQFEDGKMIPASKYFSAGESSIVELTDDEKEVAEKIRASELV